MDITDNPEDTLGAAGGDESETLRDRIFSLLLTEQEEMTPSEIGAQLDTPRQNVQYHLSTLVKSGFVVQDDGGYYVQPIFIDPEFTDAFEDAFSDLVPHTRDKIYVGDDVVYDDEIVVLNCLRTAMAINIFGLRRQ